MKRRLRLNYLFALIVAIGAGALFPTGASARLPTIWTGFKVRHSFALRPPEISYTGDGTAFLGGSDGTGIPPDFGTLSWFGWSRKQAGASGEDWLNDCTPDCAHGSFNSALATATAFRVRRHQFTRLTIVYNFQDQLYSDRRRLVKTGLRGNYAWAPI